MRTVVIMAVALAACRFAADDAAARFRCQESSDCPVGLECRAGWCEEPGGSPADADPEPLDAADLACPCSLWDEEPVPDSLNQNDGSSIELAVKFRTDVIGQVVALRYYRSDLSVGRHVGRLWTSEGEMIGEVEYEGETASGWQEQALSAPVALEANRTYLASVFIESGYYAADTGYFDGSGLDRPPLHALADGADGSNGVFVLGAGFPDVSTYASSNYWVDLVFEGDRGGAVRGRTMM